MEDGVLTARLTYRYQGEEGNVFNEARAQLPEHKFFDFSMKYNPNAGNWYVGFYIRTLQMINILAVGLHRHLYKGDHILEPILTQELMV